MRELFFVYEFDEESQRILTTSELLLQQCIQSGFSATSKQLHNKVNETGILNAWDRRRYGTLLNQGLYSGRLDWLLCPDENPHVLTLGEQGMPYREVWINAADSLAVWLAQQASMRRLNLVFSRESAWSPHFLYMAAKRLQGQLNRGVELTFITDTSQVADNSFNKAKFKLQRMLKILLARQQFNLEVPGELWKPDEVLSHVDRYEARVGRLLESSETSVQERLIFSRIWVRQEACGGSQLPEVSVESLDKVLGGL